MVRERIVTMNTRMTVSLLALTLVGTALAEPVRDVQRTAKLRDVHLGGVPAQKMNDLFRERITSKFAQDNVFGEARRAFEECDDDEKGHGGLWRGEF